MVTLASLFGLPGCIVDAVRHTPDALAVVAHTSNGEAQCPACHQLSQRVHRRSTHTPRDLPIGERSARLLLHVRRFFCDYPDCPRRTFAERLPALLPFKAQRTKRLTQSLEVLGFSLGGEAGARFGEQVRLPFSADTILRVVHHAKLPTWPTPRVLGVDDCAFRKRHTYGTLRVDLEHRRPIDMLPDRSAETCAAWLRAHPGVDIIARDRSTDYARGAPDGAPTARQVADRWHLLQNMREAFERVLISLHPRLRQHIACASASSPQTRQRLKPYAQSEVVRQDQSRAERYARYTHVKRLKAAGISQRDIARRLTMSRGTVIQFAHAPSFLSGQHAKHCQARLMRICRSSSSVGKADIPTARTCGANDKSKAMAVNASRWQVWMRHQRTTPAPTTPKNYRATNHIQRGSSAPIKEQHHLPAARQLAWRAVRASTNLTDEERTRLDELRQDADVAQA